MSGPPSTQSQESRSTSNDANETGERAAFERVDWNDIDSGWRRWVSVERLLLVLGVLWLADLFRYHRSDGGAYLVMRWHVGLEDWLMLLAAVVITAYVVVPLVRNRRQTKRYLGRLRGRWGTVLSLVYLAGIMVLGFQAQLRNTRPELTHDRYQPPVGTSIDREHIRDCVGETTGDGPWEGVCQGTWEYPLGTHRFGFQMTDLLSLGARPTLYIILVTIGLIVPLATIVGLVAGYYGGLVDDLLMAYVDAQLSLPAILIYLVVYMFVLNSMFVFLVAFGLLAWGGIARIVRSETLQRREEGYVLSARAIGSSRWYVIRRHIFPNVTNSVVPATFHLIAIIILTEAGLSFLGFHPMEWSWGETIGNGLQHAPPIDAWWTTTFPAIALAVTIIACKVAGDGLRDVLDPRGE